MADFTLEIVTAERVVYSEPVSFLVAPGAAGQLGILPNHSPLLTILAPGEIRVTKDGEESYIAVSGGFLEVIGNKATILADTAEHADEIDIDRAEDALRRAEEQIESAESDLDLERALASMRRSAARLGVARRRPRRRRQAAGPAGGGGAPSA